MNDADVLDALQWVKDCGGSMRTLNNPLSHHLIQEGYVGQEEDRIVLNPTGEAYLAIHQEGNSFVDKIKSILEESGIGKTASKSNLGGKWHIGSGYANWSVLTQEVKEWMDSLPAGTMLFPKQDNSNPLRGTALESVFLRALQSHPRGSKFPIPGYLKNNNRVYVHRVLNGTPQKGDIELTMTIDTLMAEVVV